MLESQGQTTSEGQAGTSDSLPPQPSAPTTESQNQSTTERQESTSKPCTQRADVSLWAIDGTLAVEVGNGESVIVPDTTERPPTQVDVYEALVAAGHQEQADEYTDRAYRDIYGIPE
jgi:hypothetical protein